MPFLGIAVTLLASPSATLNQFSLSKVTENSAGPPEEMATLFRPKLKPYLLANVQRT